jgi:DNA helicase-2/ATP-dependent DNA helicase PcrA
LLLPAPEAGTADAIRATTGFPSPPAARDHWSGFAETIRLMHGKSMGWPDELELVCQSYAPHLERIYDDAIMHQADLVQLAQIVSGYPNREQFLAELTLDPPNATNDEAGVPLLDEDYLILSTIHSAKGQEWKSVFVLNCVDGCIPSDLATRTTPEIEEERRLLYVAMTRAKDQLQIIVPQRFFAQQQRSGGARHMYAVRT